MKRFEDIEVESHLETTPIYSVNKDKYIPSILIVDDEEYVRNFLFDALKIVPYKVEAVSNSDDAIALLEKESFDLILSDVNMPGISGMGLLSLCRDKYPHIEIILITGDPELDSAVDSIKLGAFDYLSKPILPDKLYERVSSALKQRQKKDDTLSDKGAEIQNSGYFEIRTLGAGNEGTVFLVEKNKKYYAMKILTGHDQEDPLREIKIKRFLREIEILATIDHPNIVKLIDHGLLGNDKTPYIVMEYIHGKTLNCLMNTREFSMDEKISVIIQIADVLKEVHKRGIIHRDIKPANIMITEDNILKLMDFGIARLKDSNLTMTCELLGSPAYMSPEAFDGSIEKDCRSDIFSLGILAYELFLGVRPFIADSIGELIHKIENQDPVSPTEIVSDFPRYLQNIILKMLEKDPDERFQNMEEVITALGGKKLIIRKKRGFVYKMWRLIKRKMKH